MPPSSPAPPGEPPANPEDWTDEQWLAWLDQTDADVADDSDAGPRLAAWRSHPVGGVLGAAMLGLRDAIYGRPDDEVAIVQEAAGDPPNDDLHDIRLDPDHPERSEVVVHRRPLAPGSPPPEGSL
ncbi:MAG TPA: hypothetical protein VNC61_10285 [Acidimicrobiales bacterium]|nr:hypothetical protein [Acidimicrobiales bacterium]